MRGHIRKRGHRSWAIVIDIGRDANGKRRQKWHSVKGTKRDAETKLSELLHDLDKGQYVEPSKLSVAEYLQQWLKEAEARVAAKTAERYREMIEGHITPAIGSTALADLKPLHIQDFYAKALKSGHKKGRGGLSPRTVLNMHRVLHKALDQAIKWQILKYNPATAVQPPRPQVQQMVALNDKQLAALFKSFGSSGMYFPVALAVSTGLRRGELLALRWQEIDLKKGQITVARSLEQTKDGLKFKTPKTNKSRRTVALAKTTIGLLKRRKAEQSALKLKLGGTYQDNDLVCARPDGTPWPPGSLSTTFAGHIRRHKLPLMRFHDLRHTHATQLLKQGVHPKIVSERLGHSNIAITLDTYSHVLPGMQEEAIAGLDASLAAAIKPDR